MATKNPMSFRLTSLFFFVGLCVSILFMVSALAFFSFPDAGLWFIELLR